MKHEAGLFGDGFECKCSVDVAIKPAIVLEAASKSGMVRGVKRGRNVHRVRILDWPEELSPRKEVCSRKHFYLNQTNKMCALIVFLVIYPIRNIC